MTLFQSDIAVFILAALAIGFFGVRMTHTARALASATGLGEAVMGALFIGGATSLSGIVTSVTSASIGHGELAVSNALGGIAAQTAFLAIADMAYRRVNLEHAAASAENLVMCAFLMGLLTLPLLAAATPALAVYSVHPLSLVLVAAYVAGVRLLARTHQMPMWRPKQTADTRTEADEPKPTPKRSHFSLWLHFGVQALVVGTAGWFLTKAAIGISASTGIVEGVVGGIFTAVATSLPELVIAVTAVRLRSVTLAVSDIIGGNAFDTLFLALSDLAYRDGAIYDAMTLTEHFWLAVTLLMTAILLMGLLHRQRHGIANIGLESLLILLIYGSSLAYLAF